MTMGLRDRKKRQTRDAVLAAASRLFAERGYAETSVDAIAEAAGISRRTFFRYFPGKEDAAFPRHEDRLAAFRGLLAERAADESAFAAVQRACTALAESFEADREAVVAHQNLVLTSPALVAADRVRDLEWEAAVAEALLADHPSADAADRMRVRMLAGAVMGMIRTSLRAWFAADGAPDLVALAHEGFALLERGVGAGSLEDLR